LFVAVVGGGRECGGEGEVGADVEGRVDVNQIHFASEFGQERGEHVFFIAPDEAVIPSGIVFLLKEAIEPFLSVGCALVKGFNGLKRECDANG